MLKDDQMKLLKAGFTLYRLDYKQPFLRVRRTVFDSWEVEGKHTTYNGARAKLLTLLKDPNAILDTTLYNIGKKK